MNCQRNANSVLPTELPHKFSYIVAIFIHNHFESPNSLFNENYLNKILRWDTYISDWIFGKLIFENKTKMKIFPLLFGLERDENL
jgi:hypothetical protein